MKMRRSIGYCRTFLTQFIRVDMWRPDFKHVSFGWMNWSWDVWFK